MDDNLFKEHMLKQVDALREDVKGFQKSQNTHNIRIYARLATLRAKVGIWGILGGGIAGLITVVVGGLVVEYFKKG